jgi:hypothetical protein
VKGKLLFDLAKNKIVRGVLVWIVRSYILRFIHIQCHLLVVLEVTSIRPFLLDEIIKKKVGGQDYRA